MLLNALSVCVTVLVLNLHHRQSDVPKCLQRFTKQRGVMKDNLERDIKDWKELADLVNNVLCVIYILSAVFVGTMCLVFWSQG